MFNLECVWNLVCLSVNVFSLEHLGFIMCKLIYIYLYTIKYVYALMYLTRIEFVYAKMCLGLSVFRLEYV
jgi:hypothetical protein